jgi:hypothetical protein
MGMQFKNLNNHSKWSSNRLILLFRIIRLWSRAASSGKKTTSTHSRNLHRFIIGGLCNELRLGRLCLCLRAWLLRFDWCLRCSLAACFSYFPSFLNSWNVKVPILLCHWQGNRELCLSRSSPHSDRAFCFNNGKAPQNHT